jgi:hypothetical protein
VGRVAVVALACCALAYASLPQGLGWNQNAHYALVRALAHGHANVDRYHRESGDLAWFHGHYYSTKAPGLALLTVPVYVVLDRSGALALTARVSSARDAADAAVWALGLVGCVLPGLVILLLVRRLGDELEPGYGAIAAVTIGLGSLLLPFATVLFDHLLSGCLGLAAFTVCFLRRDRAWLAGVFAGLAIVCEYTFGLYAVALGLFVLRTAGARRFVQFAAAGVVGVLPLFVFNQVVYGSAFHLSYADAIKTTGRSGHDVLGANAQGFFGVAVPSFHTAVDLLFSHIGLLTLAPLAAAGAIGWILSRRRVEVLFVLGLTLAFLVVNSGYVDPFGGFSPGPRFLIPVLPLLGVGLAPAFRRVPLLTSALAAPSIAVMVALTISRPLLAKDGRWFHRIATGSFASHGWHEIVPLCLLSTCSLAAAVRATARPRFTAADAASAAVAFTGWLVLAVFAHRLLDDHGWNRTASAAVVLLAGLGVCAAAGLPQTRRSAWARADVQPPFSST